MRGKFTLMALVATLALAACGGGGDDGTPPATGTYTLQGTVTAASNVVVDSDTNDPDATYASNNSLATAQEIGNPVMVGGFVTATPTFGVGERFTLSADQDDIFAVDLVAGQTVSLEIVNSPAADLDLGLYNVSGTLVDYSVGLERFESITAPATGRYYLRVNADTGQSNYVLTVGTGAIAATAPKLSSDFVADEAVARFDTSTVKAAGGVSSLGYTIKAGELARPMLLDLSNASTVSSLSTVDGPTTLAGTTMSSAQAAKLRTLYRLKALKARADVVSADPNYRVQAQATPNDPYYSLQWHYPLINLPQAWNITTGTPSSGQVVVAVVDTGVFLNHEDLTDKLLRNGSGGVVGYDFVSQTASSNDGDGIDANPDDPGDESTPASSSWHGTHVAGTIAANSNNGVGVTGVSWGARIMPVRVIGKGGGTSYDVMQGVRYAAGLSNDSGSLPTRSADIINLSLGCQNCYSATEQAVFTQVREAGVIVVAAAGNDGSSQPGYPASYEGVISVSAVKLDRTRASYSNYGAYVDIAAPGGDTSKDANGDGYADGVLSTLVSSAKGSDYRYYQGTSMASPHVAGVIALMKAVYPGLTPARVDALLASGALTNDIGASGRDDLYGYGLIDAAKAVLAAQQLASGASVVTLVASPTRIDFGASSSVQSLQLSLLGSGALAVASISDDADWLTVTANSVDSAGLGTYRVSVNRTGLGSGSYSANITITNSSGGTVLVPVSMLVSTTGITVNTGHYFILLLDKDLNVISQTSSESTTGAYAFTFTNVPAGSYYLYAGTDSNWDGYICDEGEVCGAYPTLGNLSLLEISADRNDLNFDAGLINSPTTLALGATSNNLKRARASTSATKGVKQ
jgi:serine protease